MKRYVSRVLTPMGAGAICFTDDVLLRFDPHADPLKGTFAQGLEDAIYGEGHPLALWVQRELDAYFGGALREFTMPVDPQVSPFFKKVLAALQQVPFGTTVSYEELALLAGSPRACRAVGTAMRNNPIPIVIPCHRVVRKDGGVGGFSMTGGVPVKERLLTFERAALEKGSGKY